MSTLLFTIAQNGYDVAFASCLRSHAAYAHRLGARYVAVNDGFGSDDPAISAWMKIPLLLRALQSGYEWVGFIDADAEVRDDAPDFRESVLREHPIGMALGRSGRINSGVILARRSESSVAYLQRVVDSLEEEIPAEDRANLKYENGNLIYVTGVLGGVEILDPRWNNTADPALHDHVRHYTGDLRDLYHRDLVSRTRWKLRKLTARRPTAQPAARSSDFVETLQRVCERAVARHSAFGAVD